VVIKIGKVKVKGGPGSGNWGHAGRPGLRGGSGKRGKGPTGVAAVGGMEKFVDVDKVSEEAMSQYKRGLLTDVEVMQRYGGYDKYVAAVSDALTEEQKFSVRLHFPSVARRSTVKPTSVVDEDALRDLYDAGITAVTSAGYKLTDVGRDVAKHIGL
jgi:hypothetical protein